MPVATNKVKTRAANVPVPQDREQANRAIAEIGRLNREIDRLKADMNDKIAAIKEAYETEAEPKRLAVAMATEGVRVWCEANRDQLTSGGKCKFHRFPAGDVAWRISPPRVTVRGVDTVIEQLRRARLDRFLRVKVEVNKEAVLAEPDAVAKIRGISIGSAGEDFTVAPFEAALDAGTTQRRAAS